MIQDVSQIPNATTRAVTLEEQRSLDASKERRAAARGDSVELSDAARQHADASKVREPLVNRVRDAIDRGEYLTEEKLDAAIDALLKDVLD